jgi:hypothetical protein
MSRHASSSNFRVQHNLQFTLDGVEFTVDEMGHWVADIMCSFPSEFVQEQFAQDVAHAIFMGVSRKVTIANMHTARHELKRLWILDNPPNHAGYYYCHIGGEWVHQSMMELDHIIPASLANIDIVNDPQWQDKLRPACMVHNNVKGSQIMPSATLEIRPPDEEC